MLAYELTYCHGFNHYREAPAPLQPDTVLPLQRLTSFVLLAAPAHEFHMAIGPSVGDPATGTHIPTAIGAVPWQSAPFVVDIRKISLGISPGIRSDCLFSCFHFESFPCRGVIIAFFLIQLEYLVPQLIHSHPNSPSAGFVFFKNSDGVFGVLTQDILISNALHSDFES